MLTDIRTLPDGAALDADLCIIGGGAAGVAMALRLRGAPLKIMLLESAGLSPDSATRALSAGETTGIPYFPLEDSRVRMLGGSTYRWGARSAPMTPVDFEARAWVPMSGWPIGPEALTPYYDPVHDLVGLRRDFDYDAGVYALVGAKPPDIDDRRLAIAAFQFGKNLVFGEAFAADIKAARNIDAYLHANVTDVDLSADRRRIKAASIRTLDGKTFTARARAFILACGGIDNPRLLLNWSGRAGACALKANAFVGRMFMEHPTLTAGVVRAKDWQALCDIFSPGLAGGRYVETGLAPSAGLQREAKILNAVARVRPIISEDATQALREIIWNARHRKIPLSLNWYKNEWLKARVDAILKDPFSIPLNILRHMQGKPKRFRADSVVLELRTEQAPNPESRVTLSDAVDPFGMRRARLNWAMTALDKRTMRVMAETVDGELRRLGLGALESAEWLKSDDLLWADDLVGGHHHMGTTRMSASPSDGVVDADCKMHGLDNLYVAGGSVFPTASFVNPTFTILCLALRLADHVRARLAGDRTDAPAADTERRRAG